jgi:hypothetical protein
MAVGNDRAALVYYRRTPLTPEQTLLATLERAPPGDALDDPEPLGSGARNPAYYGIFPYGGHGP